MAVQRLSAELKPYIGPDSPLDGGSASVEAIRRLDVRMPGKYEVLSDARHTALPLIALVATGLIALSGCGGDGGEDEGKDTDAQRSAPAPAETAAGERAGEGKRAERGGGAQDDAEADPAAAVRRAVDAYVAALSAGDGERVCELFAPDALAGLELPEERGDCAGSLAASIGYRDPRGLPQFERAELAELSAVELSGETARVTATIVTFFADRDEPSIEDDLIYLERSDDGWLVEKPSALLYRAIGAEIPLEALRAPDG